MPIVAMPDGTQVSFPDEMPKEQIRDLILRKFPDAGTAAPQQAAPAEGGAQPSPAFTDALAQIRARAPGAVSEASQPGMAAMSEMTTGFQNAPQEDVDRNVRANLEATKIDNMQGNKGLIGRAAEATSANLPFADEMYSGTVGGLARMARDGVGYGEAYKREQALAAAQKAKRGTAANLIGDVAGGLAIGSAATGGPLTMTSGGTVAASRPAWGGLTLMGRASGGAGKLAAAAAEGGAYGGLYGGANAKEGERLQDAAYGAGAGAVTGGLLEGAGGVISRALAPKGPATQTASELAQEGRALYDVAANAGVTVKPTAINNAAGNVTMKLKSFGFDKDLQPKTAVVAKKLLEARNKTLDLAELDNIRKMASGIAREQSAASSDRAASGIIVEQIDNIINDTNNFSAGSSQALDALKQGREVWKRKMKTETLEDIVENAKNQATGFENGLVIHLRALANNKTKMRAFSKAEQKMIKSVVRRGSGHGALRALGMLAPNSTFGGMIAANTAFNTGVIPGLGLAAAGGIAKVGAGALTRGKVNALQRAVSTGQTPNMLALPNYLRPAIGAVTAGTVGTRPQGLLGN